MAIPKLVMAIFQGRTLCAPTLSRIYVNDFVGDGVLDVPQFKKKAAKWNGEGAVPYRLIFLINKIDLSDTMARQPHLLFWGRFIILVNHP